jgi:hypothetical protein
LDHIFVLNSLIQTQLLKNQKLYSCFIDLSQAFDSPDHNRLWKVLLGAGVSSRLVSVLKFIYENAYARVNTSDGLTEKIKIMKGVLQGETASPTIFNLFLDGLAEKLEKSGIAGLRLLSHIVHILLYADDMVIVAPSAETLQMKLITAANFLKERGLLVNLGKTKVVIFRRKGRLKKNETFNWNRSPIEIVPSYTYLGVTFSSSGLFHVAAAEAVKKGLAAQGATIGTIKKAKTFSLATAPKLYDSIVLSTTLYAAGTWGLNVSESLERVQQQYFKRVLNMPTCTPKYFIRLETGQAHISQDTLKLALAMLRRIRYSNPNSLLYEAFDTLRRVSLLLPDINYSWYLQLKSMLVSIDEESLIDNSSPIYLSLRTDRVLEKHRWRLGELDVEKARNSKSIPHYFNNNLIYSIFPEPYLKLSLPPYLISCICQIRLNYPLLFVQGSWHNLGIFEGSTCRFCGEDESLLHLFNCPQYLHLKSKFVSSDPSFDPLTTVLGHIDVPVCKKIYYFIASALKLRLG